MTCRYGVVYTCIHKIKLQYDKDLILYEEKVAAAIFGLFCFQQHTRIYKKIKETLCKLSKDDKHNYKWKKHL